jgi:pimeloyl-[acyl-carrier protein] methyl ester esterase
VLRLLAHADLRSLAPRIAAPTLVVAGSHDVLAPAPAGAWLARAIAGARYAEIEGAAHAPFLSHRDAFLATVRAFLDEHAELSRT